MTERNQLLRTRVLGAALAAAQERGWRNLTRESIASQAEVSVGSVSNAFGTMTQLRHAVMEAAVEREIAAIVADGLALGYEVARNAPKPLKVRALALLAA